MVMSSNPGRRSSMIDMLIDDDLNTMKQDDNWCLSEILLSGFKGYENFTDNELVREMNDRDLWQNWFKDEE